MTAHSPPCQADPIRRLPNLSLLLIGTWLLGTLTSLAAWLDKGILSGRGGLYFPFEVKVKVPHFSQRDRVWGNDSLGNTPATLAAEGCAVACASMVLASYNVDVDPGRLNRFLGQLPGGYTDRGWIEWFKAAEYTPSLQPELLPHYEDLPSYFFMDMNLLQGNPVIVRFRTKHDTTHFMVVIGKQGFDYLVLDPGKDLAVPQILADYGRPIEALRFFRKPLFKMGYPN